VRETKEKKIIIIKIKSEKMAGDKRGFQNTIV
jgi:ribosomal protein L21